MPYMQNRPDTDNYRLIFLNGTPILDTRAPGEFAKGAFPNTVNIPLMSDDERAEVGTCYKQQGQEAAIELGHKLVSGDIKDQRIAAWRSFAEQHPEGYLYCFRGGLRSQISQQWLDEAGQPYPRITGGYKAMRNFLIEELERSIENADIILVSGATGSGKTRVIEAINNAIDLEGLAKHRGSAFGHLIVEQPSQIDFENALSIAFMQQLHAQPDQPVYLEDEGRLIGRLSLPENLRDKMKQAPMLVVDEPFEDRVDLLVEDYVVDLGQRFQQSFGEAGAEKHREKMLADLYRVRKRLGGERHQKTAALLEGAFTEQANTGSITAHREWIAILLGEYYDAMYEYQLGIREGEVLARGSRAEMINWINNK